MANDLKRDYLIKTFSRTKRKDYENYIINAIWHKLDNLNIKPVTQQYVKRGQGKYALIDLYFPQLNIAIECDEKYHKKNKLKDAERELDIEEKLGAINDTKFHIERIDASKTLKEIDGEIDKIVEIIRNEYNKKDPKPSWNIVDDPVKEAKQKGSISADDDIRFRNIYNDIYRLFGKNPAANPRVRCTFNITDSAYVWCPKMASIENNKIISGNKNWLNLISDDMEYIYEKSLNMNNRKTPETYLGKKKNRYKDNDKYVFGKVKDHLGQRYYKFLGVYYFDYFDNVSKRAVFKLKDKELNLQNIKQHNH
jgi:very-short-patch-repair endonuclease